jgi:hypothetical protein
MTAARGSADPRDVAFADLLTLCSRVVNEMRRNTGRGVRVIPVLLDDTARWAGALKALFEAGQGAVVIAEDSGAGVDSGDDAAPEIGRLTAAVDEVLVQLARRDAGSYGGLRIDSSVHGRRGIVGTVPFIAANRAQQTVRGLLAAVFSTELRTTQTPIILWDDSALDQETSRTVFALCQRLPELLGLATGTTLVIVVGDGELRGDHLSGKRSLRYRLTGRGLQRRDSFETSVQRVAAWERYAPPEAPLAVLMLGAGASVNAGLPTGNQLRDQALSARYGKPIDAATIRTAGLKFWNDLWKAGRLTDAEMAQGSAAFVDGLTLERVLREEQHDENQVMSGTLRWFKARHRDVVREIPKRFPRRSDKLRKLLARQRQLVLVTVNFDQVVETRAGSNVLPIVTEADFVSFAVTLDSYLVHGGPVPLLKIHGDIDHPATLVANVDATVGGLSSSRLAAIRTLREKLDPVRPWWYVGYSMRDLDLRPVLAAPDFSDGLVESWVSPLPDEAVTQFVEQIRQPRWRSIGSSHSIEDRLVTLTAEEFWRQLDRSLPP